MLCYHNYDSSATSYQSLDVESYENALRAVCNCSLKDSLETFQYQYRKAYKREELRKLSGDPESLAKEISNLRQQT